jgi:hypothetical protein
MKTLAATATILGWWGGAAWPMPMSRTDWSSLDASAPYTTVIGDNTPLLFTPSWDGTDIFLWAIVSMGITAVTTALSSAKPAQRIALG